MQHAQHNSQCIPHMERRYGDNNKINSLAKVRKIGLTRCRTAYNVSVFKAKNIIQCSLGFSFYYTCSADRNMRCQYIACRWRYITHSQSAARCIGHTTVNGEQEPMMMHTNRRENKSFYRWISISHKNFIVWSNLSVCGSRGVFVNLSRGVCVVWQLAKHKQ